MSLVSLEDKVSEAHLGTELGVVVQFYVDHLASA